MVEHIRSGRRTRLETSSAPPESGHAVAAFLAGIGLEHVSAIPNDEAWRGGYMRFGSVPSGRGGAIDETVALLVGEAFTRLLIAERGAVLAGSVRRAVVESPCRRASCTRPSW